MWFGVWGFGLRLGLEICGLGFGVEDSGFGIGDWGFGVESFVVCGLWIVVCGLWFGVKGLDRRVSECLKWDISWNLPETRVQASAGKTEHVYFLYHDSAGLRNK